MEIIKHFDFLGEKPKLLFNRETNHKTKFGGLLSIISSLVILTAAIFFTKSLFERSNFTVMLNEELNPDSSINWTNKELSITIYDKLGDILPDSERIYGVTGTYFWNVKNSTHAKTYNKFLNIEKCNSEKHFSEYNNLWNKEHYINGSLCLQKNQEIITHKPFGAVNFSNIVFWVHMCKNTTTKNDCYPEEKIRQTLLNTFTIFRIVDVYFDHNDKNQFAKPFIYTDTIQTSISIYKRIFYSFKIVDYYSDENFIFTDNSLNSYVTIADYKEAVDLRPLNSTTIPNSFMVISFSNYIRKQVFYRRYYKAQNMIADVGGIIKAILLMATLINKVLDERLYYTDIINSNLNHMNISIDKVDGRLKLDDISNIERKNKFIGHSENNVIMDNPVFINYINVSKIKNEIKNKIELPIYISCIPRFLLSSKNNQKKLLEKLDVLTNTVKKQLDIKSVISKLNNIDKLAYMFFGNENYSLLEDAPNPYLQNISMGNKEIIIKQNNNESENILSRINKNYNTLFKNK